MSPPSLMSTAPTSTALPRTSLPKERVSLAPPIQIRTQYPSASSHITPEADRDMSQPIPGVERHPFSLPTGPRPPRCPKQSRVPSGRGSLRIVNGTQADALVKLGEYAERGGRLMKCIYVKAGQEITIDKIGEGAYRLAFSLGIDWDQATKEFRNDKAYTMFDEPFEFEETRAVREVRTDEGLEVQTTVGFTEAVATLHGVPDGHAKTSSIEKSTFDRLFEDRD